MWHELIQTECDSLHERLDRETGEDGIGVVVETSVHDFRWIQIPCVCLLVHHTSVAVPGIAGLGCIATCASICCLSFLRAAIAFRKYRARTES